jgi:hypothetical protein
MQLTPEQETERLTRTLYVGNVPADTKPKALRRLFAEWVKQKYILVTVKGGRSAER